MAARVREGRVGRAGAAEFCVELDVAADVDDQQERRPAFVGRQRTRVLVGLVVRAQHRLVPAAAVERLAGLLRLGHKTAAPVEVDEAVADAAIGRAHDDAALEDAGVVARVVAGGLGLWQVEQRAEFGEKELVVGALATAGFAPALDEGFDGGVGGYSLLRVAKRRNRNPRAWARASCKGCCQEPCSTGTASGKEAFFSAPRRFAAAKPVSVPLPRCRSFKPAVSAPDSARPEHPPSAG